MADPVPDLPRKIIRNTLHVAAARVWGGIVMLFLAPYIIHHIGGTQYGIWAVIGMVTGYFGLFDLGVETAFVKYISEFHAKGDCNSINRVVNTGIVFYSLLMLIVLLVMGIFIGPIFSFLNISLSSNSDLMFTFWTVATVFCLTNAFSPITAIQNGLQRMDLANKVSICMTLLTVAGSIYFLEQGYGIKGLAITSALVFCCSGFINLVIAFRVFPQLRLDPRLFSSKKLALLFRYGYKLQVSRLANLISFQADNLLISHFLGVALVTYYQLGTTVVQQSRLVLLLLTSALVPAVSELLVRNDHSRLEGLFLRGSKYLIALSVPLTVFLVLEAPLIVTTWMGDGYGTSVLVIQVLAVGYCAATVTGVASSIAAGAGLTDLDMKFGLLMASMNLVLGVLMIMNFGMIGVLVATTVSLMISSLFYMYLFHKRMNIFTLNDFVHLFRSPALCCIVPTGIVLGVNYFFYTSSFFTDRIFAGSFLVINLIVFAIIYPAGLLRSRYFDGYDTALLCDRLPLIKRIFPNAL